MTRVIRTLLAAGALAGAIVVGLPFYCGVRFEARFRDELADLATASPYTVTLVSYRRGLFGATADTQLEIANPAAAAEHAPDTSQAALFPMRVLLHHRISHGPRLDGLRFARMVTTPELPESAPQSLAKLFDDQSPLTVSVDFGFDGAADARLISPAGATTVATGDVATTVDTRLEWGGLDGHFRLARGASTFTSTFLAPRVFVQHGEPQVVIDTISGTGDMFRGALSRAWLGSGAVAVDGIRVTTGTQSFSVEKLMMGSTGSEEGGAVNSTITFSAARAVGAGETVEQPTLRVSFSNVDAVALREWDETAHAAGDLQDRLRQVSAAMKSAAAKLAPRRPIVAIEELSFRNANGAAKLSGHVQYVGNGAIESFSPRTDLDAKLAVELPTALFDQLAAQKLKADLRQQAAANTVDAKPELAIEARLDAQARAGVAAMRQSFIDQNFLKVDGDHLTSNVEFHDGTLTVNGTPVPQ